MNFVFNEMFLVFPVNVSGEDIKQRLKVKATKSRIKQEGKSAPWLIKRIPIHSTLPLLFFLCVLKY